MWLLHTGAQQVLLRDLGDWGTLPLLDVAPGDVVCGGLGSAGVMVGCDDFRGLFQPKWFLMGPLTVSPCDFTPLSADNCSQFAGFWLWFFSSFLFWLLIYSPWLKVSCNFQNFKLNFWINCNSDRRHFLEHYLEHMSSVTSAFPQEPLWSAGLSPLVQELF